VKYIPTTRLRRGRRFAPRTRREQDRSKAAAEIALHRRLTKLAVLDDALNADGSAAAAAAAFVRLADALGQCDATTSTTAARQLRSDGHDGPADLIEALYMARWRGDYDGAELLIAPHREQTWAKTARLHLMIQRERPDLIERAMVDLGEAGPSQLLQLLLLPARDPKTTQPERFGVYRLLMRVLRGRLVNQAFARQVHRTWMSTSPCRLGWGATGWNLARR
jgi:hypothetical protein